MPDNGQYFIAVLLSLVNVIYFRRVILKQTITNKVIISILVSLFFCHRISSFKVKYIKRGIFQFFILYRH